MKVMVVESPAKAKKIGEKLGGEWTVLASSGHIRDLPRHELGIELTSFDLVYEFIPPSPKPDGSGNFPGGEDRVRRIRKAMAGADTVVIASDPDREGEAIAWHLREALGLRDGDYQRVTFTEITEAAVRAGLAKPRKIDMALVRAQEARRALDRMVGFLVSPLLTDKLGINLSAGRVQSIVVRLVVDLERRIRAFTKTDHFGAEVSFSNEGKAWKARWDTAAYVNADVPYVMDEALANRAAGSRNFVVRASKSEPVKVRPPAVFSTSTLLQAASKSLKMPSKRTTKALQGLYEAGLVTYPRTDTVNMSAEFSQRVREYAAAKGLPASPEHRKYTGKAGAQEGHAEGVRVVDIAAEEVGQTADERAVYRLIWQRTMASQLVDAVYSSNSLQLEATDTGMQFKAASRVLLSSGWQALTASDAAGGDDASDGEDDSGAVPALAQASAVTAAGGKVVRKHTSPPRRYTEEGLFKKLEAEGIGRPATYAPIMDNIQQRGYVIADKDGFFSPSETGELLVDTLVAARFGFMELDFTRDLEAELDDMAEGKASYAAVVGRAYGVLDAELQRIASNGDLKPRHVCDKCGCAVRRYNPATGPFWRCTGDECKTYFDDVNGQPMPRQVHACPTCESGQLRRFKRKSGPGHLWACTVEGCDTFMDDVDGKPQAQAVYPCPKCQTRLRRFQRKDKDTGKPKGGHAWVCPAEGCDTFLDDDRGKPVVVKTAPCPACAQPMHRRKSKEGGGWWWGCTGFKAGCKVVMDDDNGRPVPRGTGPAKKPAKKTAKGGPKLVPKPIRYT